MLADDSEKQDMKIATEAEGYKINDFTISEKANSLPKRNIISVTGIVEIQRISTGRSRLYKAGNKSNWPAEFHRELKMGLFD